MAGSIVGSLVQHRSRGVVRLKAAITCDAAGTATATVIGSLFGKLVGVIYDAGTLDTGVDLTVTDSESGATLFSLTNAGTADRFLRPTQVVTDNTGTAVTASTSAADVNRDIFLAGRVTVAAAQGGVAGAGALTFLVDEGVAA